MSMMMDMRRKGEILWKKKDKRRETERMRESERKWEAGTTAQNFHRKCGWKKILFHLYPTLSPHRMVWTQSLQSYSFHPPRLFSFNTNMISTRRRRRRKSCEFHNYWTNHVRMKWEWNWIELNCHPSEEKSDLKKNQDKLIQRRYSWEKREVTDRERSNW